MRMAAESAAGTGVPPPHQDKGRGPRGGQVRAAQGTASGGGDSGHSLHGGH